MLHVADSAGTDVLLAADVILHGVALVLSLSASLPIRPHCGHKALWLKSSYVSGAYFQPGRIDVAKTGRRRLTEQ